MYVVIGSKTYTKLSNLQFRPETDVTASSVPVNELWVSIKTDDYISVGSRVSLYDDLDTLWAKYWVVYAEREEKGIMRVHGQSALMKLDTVTLDPIMYSGTSVSTALSTVLSVLGGEYTLDSSFSSATLTGYAPKQSARVRLQWICLCIGAYLKDFFGDRLEILPMDDDEVGIIPMSETYWKPKVTFRDYVTGVRATYYTYTAGTPSRTDEYVEVDGTTYIQTEAQITLTDTTVPAIATENVVEVDGMTLVNYDNVSDILSFLAKYYFKRTEVDLSCIDNGTWYPGQRVLCYTDEETMYSGYINECVFSFGLQAKADIHMTPTETQGSDVLTVLYMWEGIQVGQRMFRLPVGYEYEIDNPHIDMVLGQHRYVFRPTTATITGTMQSGGSTVTQQMEIALDLYENRLHVKAVDGAEVSEGVAVIE